MQRDELIKAIKAFTEKQKPCPSYRPPRGKLLGAPCVVCGFSGIKHKFKQE